MGVIVTAVVGSNDNGIFLWNCVHDACNILPAVLKRLHIFLAHPTVCMPCLVGITEIKKGQIGIGLLDVSNGGIGQAIVGFVIADTHTVDQQRIRQGCRIAKVAQLSPTVKGCNIPFLYGEDIEQSQKLTCGRYVCIALCAVALGGHAEKERHVARKCDRRHNRLCIERINRICHHLLRGLAICKCIGAHTVNQNQQCFHICSSKLKLILCPYYSTGETACQ